MAADSQIAMLAVEPLVSGLGGEVALHAKSAPCISCCGLAAYAVAPSAPKTRGQVSFHSAVAEGSPSQRRC